MSLYIHLKKQKWRDSARNEEKKSGAVFTIIYPRGARNEINPFIFWIQIKLIVACGVSTNSTSYAILSN